MGTNLKQVFFFSQAMVNLCLKLRRGGKTINMASLLSFQVGIRVPAYTTSKSGVLGLTRALGNEWAVHGINVNVLIPGYMTTKNTEKLRCDEEKNAAILSRIPEGRWGSPDDFAGQLVFLASAASRYVHGAALAVDGGWLAR